MITCATAREAIADQDTPAGVDITPTCVDLSTHRSHTSSIGMYHVHFCFVDVTRVASSPSADVTIPPRRTSGVSPRVVLLGPRRKALSIHWYWLSAGASPSFDASAGAAWKRVGRLLAL